MSAALLATLGIALFLPWPTIGQGVLSAARWLRAAAVSVAGKAGSFRKRAGVLLVLAALGMSAWEYLPVPSLGGGGPGHDTHVAYAHLRADVWIEAALKLDEGAFKSDRELHDWLTERTKQARETAFAPLAKLEQETFGGEQFDPAKAAALFRKFAKEARGVR